MAVKQRLDTPTNNFATWNSLFVVSSPLYEGNLYAYGTTSGARSAFSTFEIPTTGKWYVEILSKDNQYPQAGIARREATGSGNYTACYGYYDNDTSNSPFALYDGASTSAATTLKDGFNLTSNSITRIYIDADKNQMWMGKDTTWATGDNTLGSVPTFGSGGTYNGSTPLNFADGYYIFVSNGNGSDKWFLNAGQDASFNGNKTPTKVYTDARGLGRFYYQPPEGALALCTANIGGAISYKSAPTSYVSDETNTKILTYNGNVEQVPYSPYATDGYSLYSSNAGLKLTDTAANFNYLHNNTTHYTISFWMYRMKDMGASEIILDSSGGTTTKSGFNMIVDGGGTDKLRIYINGGTGSSNNAFKFESNYVVPLRKWVHVSFVFDYNASTSSDKGKLYIDGSLYDSGTHLNNNTFSSSDAGHILTLGSDDAGTTEFYGYIADFRIVKNKTVTTSVPSSPYSVSETNQDILISASSNSIKDSNTAATAKTVTPVGSGEVSIEAWSPYSTDAIEFGTEYRTPETAHGIGSFSFDGNSQQLKFATSADFELTGNATVEMWLYLNSAIAGNTPLFGYGNDAGTDYFSLNLAANGKLQWYNSGSLVGEESAVSVIVGQWHHIALVRDGNAIKVYNNGVEKIASGTNSASYYTSNGTSGGSAKSFPTGHVLRIGSWYNSGNYGANGHLNGYIADYRVVNGTAVYTGAFTPPSGKLTATGGTYPSGTNVNTSITSGHTKLLLQPYKSYDANNLLTSNFSYKRDSSSTQKSLTYVNDTKIVDESPYKSGANGSFSFSNFNSKINIPIDSNSSLGSGEFTIEFWLNLKDKHPSQTGTPNPQTFLVMNDFTGNFWGIYYYGESSHPNRKLSFIGYYNGADLNAGGKVTAVDHFSDKRNSWVHIAYTRDNSDPSDQNRMRLYVNGSEAKSWTEGTDFSNITGTLSIGGYGNLSTNDQLNGMITDIRIVKGTAVYTGAFSPPYDKLTLTQSAGTNISAITSGQTKLLLQPGALASNEPAKKPFEHFKPVIYTGQQNADAGTWNNGTSTSTITVGFQPDLVWMKGRNYAEHHNIIDSVRGVTQRIQPNRIESQTSSAQQLKSFTSTGFTLGTNHEVNNSSSTFVAWSWKAGGATPSKTYYVKVSGGLYQFIDDISNSGGAANHPILNLQKGGTYTFDQSDSTNDGHPLLIYADKDKTAWSGAGASVVHKLDGSTVTSTNYGNTTNFNAASSRQTILTVPSQIASEAATATGTLSYQCYVHGAMGGSGTGTSSNIQATATHGQTEFGGSIIPIVSANKEAGFSIVKYTGNGTNGATLAHGLGKKPKIIIEKAYAGASTYYNWSVQGCGELWTPATSTLFLNTVDDLNPSGAHGAPPDTNTFYPSKTNYANENNVENIAYVWTDIEGYSAFGSYEGNGASNANGPLVYLGFRPAFLLMKNIDNTTGYSSWYMADSVRSENNPAGGANTLWSNEVFTEGKRGNGDAIGSNNWLNIDFLSNGFKVRADSSVETNATQTYIYMAFAEAPVNFSNAR